METKTMITESERKELETFFLEGQDIAVVIAVIDRLLIQEFYLGYLSDTFDRGWEAYCKRYGIEFKPHIMLTEKNKWVNEVRRRNLTN